ncbi:MAG: exodeoxyribonuclease VII small subunit [Planctomycetes bacterium]|nr:exodeoxyribonuclease VII small subunit [Planctomycetota bacterium]
MSQPTNSQPDDPQPCFEESLAELESIVRELEDGQIGLSEALARYEQGVRLLRECYALLERAERRIELLSGVDAAGNAQTVPFDDQASLDLAQKSQRRAARRSAPRPQPAAAEPEGRTEPEPEIDLPGTLF